MPEARALAMPRTGLDSQSTANPWLWSSARQASVDARSGAMRSTGCDAWLDCWRQSSGTGRPESSPVSRTVRRQLSIDQRDVAGRVPRGALLVAVLTEEIARGPDREQMTRVERIGFELVSEPGHVRIYGAADGAGMIAPDVSQQFGA